MKEAARLDFPVGIVPDYATFVRHVWRYEDQECGRVIGDPPWMYSVLFEDTDEAGVVFNVIQSIVEPGGASCSKPLLGAERIEIVTSALDGLTHVYEVRFADLQALHVFLLMLGTQASIDPVARQVGEFLMWTLGFRWV